MANEQENKGGPGATRADTLAEQGAQPVQGKEGPVGADIVGAAGGTDAAAGAQMSGNRGPGGAGLRQADAAGAPGSPGGSTGAAGGSPGAGAMAAGGTGLGQADTADDTRTGTGSSTGQGTSAAAGGDPSGGNTLAGKPGQGKQP
jgi:hypothetical protein